MTAARTIRQQIIDILSQNEMTASDLSHTLGIKEKEVHEHLPHIFRSAAARGWTLEILPSECLNCGFVFKNRKRFTPPGRCPHCKSTYIQKPNIRLSESRNWQYVSARFGRVRRQVRESHAVISQIRGSRITPTGFGAISLPPLKMAILLVLDWHYLVNPPVEIAQFYGISIQRVHQIVRRRSKKK